MGVELSHVPTAQLSDWGLKLFSHLPAALRDILAAAVVAAAVASWVGADNSDALGRA